MSTNLAGWGPWRDVTSCSKTCGTGIIKQKRKCQNADGCDGRKKRKIECNTHECLGKLKLQLKSTDHLPKCDKSRGCKQNNFIELKEGKNKDVFLYLVKSSEKSFSCYTH